jgi:two-component system phosphate regulon sensor histidine kinase PhoR
MSEPQRVFPWKVARQFFLIHLGFAMVAVALTGYALRSWVHVNFTQSAGELGTELAQTLARFDGFLLSIFATLFFFAALVLALTTRYYARPLGLLLERARELRRLDRPVSEEFTEDEMATEEPGEWFHLERALGQLHRDLVLKSDELKREREELSTLIGAMSDAILAVDRNGEPLFYNSQFALFFRSPKGAGKPLRLTDTFRVPEVLAGYREVLDSGASKSLTTPMRTTVSEVPRHFSISIAPLRTRDDRSTYGAVGIFHDITELKQTEQIRIEFVGNASHELRTPLTTIKGYVSTLRDDLKEGRTDGASQFVDIIARNVDRMIALVNDLLDLSALDSGAELAKSEISTQEVTETALRSLESKRSARRQEIHTRYGAPTVFADPRRVEQVVVNLVHNAIKYIPEGRRIDIAWEKRGEFIELRVKDNGPGIPIEHHTRLFERFYRVDAGRSRDAGGTGLGLSIVKHIMLKHGGSVRLESKPGAGAEFICSFKATCAAPVVDASRLA